MVESIKELPFNEKLFNLTRLNIMVELDDNAPMSFSELKALLELTDGNLVSHLRVLENLGFINAYKSFVNKKPRTTYTMTTVGKQNFEDLKTWFYQVFLEGG